MKVLINIDRIAPLYQESISVDLEKEGIPGCLGNMVLPILDKFIEVDTDDVFKKRDSIAPADLIIESADEIIENPNQLTQDLAVDREGLSNLKTYKKGKSDRYVTRIKRCVNCEYQSLCYMLTHSYLLAVKND